MELYKRIKSGDLKERYENEVINLDHPDRDAMMSVMNSICGNMELECSYAVYSYSAVAYYDPGNLYFSLDLSGYQNDRYFSFFEQRSF